MSPAVVKANYMQMCPGTRQAAAASANYYSHRPNGEGEREYRPGFDADSDEVAKSEVHERIEQGSGNYAYRIVVSPGEEMEADELRDWARDVMEPVESTGTHWTGWVHDDHTNHPHCHIIAYTDTRLDRDDFQEMRGEGDSWHERLESCAEWARREMEDYTEYGVYLLKRGEQISAEWGKSMESYAEYGVHLIEKEVMPRGETPKTETEQDPMLEDIEAADVARINEEIDRESEQPTIGLAEPPAEPLDDPVVDRASYREREEDHGLG